MVPIAFLVLRPWQKIHILQSYWIPFTLFMLTNIKYIARQDCSNCKVNQPTQVQRHFVFVSTREQSFHKSPKKPTSQKAVALLIYRQFLINMKEQLQGIVILTITSTKWPPRLKHISKNFKNISSLNAKASSPHHCNKTPFWQPFQPPFHPTTADGSFQVLWTRQHRPFQWVTNSVQAKSPKYT